MKIRAPIKWILSITAILLLLGIGVGILLTTNSGKTAESETVSKETRVEKGNLTVGVTETGSVSIGSLTQGFDVDVSGSTANMGNNATTPNSASNTPVLEVEEIYALVGKEVKKGDPILKLTKKSVNEMTEYLEGLINSAKSSLKEAKIQRDVKKLQAETEYDSNVSLGKIAKTEYDTTLKSLSEAVTKAQKDLNEAKTRISEIPSEITALKKKKSKAAKEEEKQSLQNQIDTLKKELENYKNNYSSLKTKVSEEKSKQATGKIDAKKKYEEAMVNYNNAKEIYNVAVEGIENDVDTAKEEVKDAEETYSKFKQFVGDGNVTATYDGIITSLGYAAGDELDTATSIATYTDKEAVGITVSVSEEDVSAIQIGNRAAIIFTAYPEDGYEGTVSSIATSESDSSTVSYDVTVSVSGDTGKLYDGMTGNVTFVTKEVNDVLYVSNKAITLEGTKSYVLKKEGEASVKLEVVTGFSDGVHVEVKEGLQEGDVVLIESQVNGS